MKWVLIFFSAFFWAFPIKAHERWILSPQQILEWNEKFKPSIFTDFGLANTLIITIAFLFAAGWVRLGQTGARELFADLQIRLSSHGNYASVILRFCTAWTLISSAIALDPRFGNAIMAIPTLFAPDLELRQLGSQWQGLKYVELTLGILLLVGIYTRVVAFLLICLVLLGWYLFGHAVVAYLTVLLGIGIYLLLQGGGSFYIPFPYTTQGRKLADKLGAIPRTRAQFILRIMAGLNFLYLGIYFKVMQPNLALGLINIHDVPILSLHPELFVLIMAVVEILTGVFLLMGILMRPMSLFLLATMILFAFVLPESFTAHMLYYGVMLTFWFNSAGYWKMPKAKDKPAHIVILGSGFAAVAAALRLEKLLGPYTNVKVTLITKDLHFVFSPLLPEVMSGSLQPGAMINPLRRIFQYTHLVSAEVENIKSSQHQLLTLRLDDELHDITYDKLILARDCETNLSQYTGLAEHGLPLHTVGDALFIRQHIIRQFEKALLLKSNEQKKLLTFVVIGNGEKGAATAIELSRQLNAIMTAYKEICADNISVFLIETGRVDLTHPTIRVRNKLFSRYNIHYIQGTLVSIAHETIHLSSSQIDCHTVINCLDSIPYIYLDDELINDCIETDDYCRASLKQDIYICGSHNQLLQGAQLDLVQQKRIGATAAYNAWASTQSFAEITFDQKPRKRYIYHMARNSIVTIGQFTFAGPLGWCIGRYQCMQVLPGLERNLRMIIDWLLDIPFRNDIAVLESERTDTIEHLSFYKGEKLMREGEEGDCAYIIQRGVVSISVDGVEVVKRGKSACVGEMALIENTKRSATVTCLTDVLVTKVTQSQFDQLFTGLDVISEALHLQSKRRRENIENTKLQKTEQ